MQPYTPLADTLPVHVPVVIPPARLTKLQERKLSTNNAENSFCTKEAGSKGTVKLFEKRSRQITSEVIHQELPKRTKNFSPFS
ncbi:hypothetical protein ACFL2H_08035 [Planctomycetota bacterium]